MGVLRSALRASITGSSGIATPEQWVVDWVRGGEETAAGVRVDEETALHYSAFWAGVRVISEDVASLPLITYERLDPRGKRRATDHALYPLLHDRPNDIMSSVQLREVVQGHALTWGTGWIYVVRNGAGEVIELWPLRPDRIKPEKTYDPTGRFKVLYNYDDRVNNIKATLFPDQVLPVAGLGWDGVRGYSVVQMAANSLGLSLATERYGASFFGGGARPGGVLSHPGVLSDPARKRIKADWDNLHRGLDRAQRVAVLEEGVAWQQIGIPPEDAQFLGTRKFQVTEASRWLRLPPHKIGDLERATFSNIEQQQLDYVTSAVRIWLVRWEQAILTRLLTETERPRFFAEHLVDALLRGDTISRYNAYAIGRNWGWLSADDVRELENMNPLPDGKGSVYLVPLNMVPAAADSGPAPERALQMARELRGRSAEGRRRIAETFRPLVVDADLRLAKLERAEVASLVRRHLARGRSVVEFLAAVEVLYQGLIRDRQVARWLPLFTAFAAEIVADAAADVGHDGEIDLQVWVAAYVASHVAYRIGSAASQLRSVVDAGAAGPVEDLAAAVLARLDAWVADRPERTARWETSQLPNAAAREAWREAGVRRLTWVTVGDTCPFCRKLDGAVVGITEPFVAAGGEVTGLEEQLQIDRNTFHPPLHAGCDCVCVPA